MEDRVFNILASAKYIVDIKSDIASISAVSYEVYLYNMQML